MSIKSLIPSEKSLIPGYKKENVEENIYQPHPQVEFADSTIPDRIREFDEQIQSSTALIIRAQEMLRLYRYVPPLPKKCSPPILESCYLHFKNLAIKEKQLKDRLSLLRDRDKSSYSLLEWIKKINKEIQSGIALLPHFYDSYHRTYHECTVEGLQITSNEDGSVTTRRSDGGTSTVRYQSSRRHLGF